MNPQFQRWMDKATRLTRAGDLRAATAAIRAALGGSRPPPANDEVCVIDVEAREVPSEPVCPPFAERCDEPFIDLPTSPAAPDVPPVDPPVYPPTDRFIAGHYADAHGARDYKLFIPSAAADGMKSL